MTLSFRYKTIKRPDGTQVKTPSIPITLIGKESVDTIGLLDSGADISAIPKGVAEILGLSLEGKKSTAYGIGGSVQSIDSKVTVRIEKGHEVHDFNIPIKIILDDYDFPVLLGRNGIFDRFIVTFNQKEERVYLKYKS